MSINQEKLKQYKESKAQRADQTQECGPYDSATTAGPGWCCAPPFVERVRSERFQAEKQAMKAQLLLELETLLEKHPDVARILDLMELVKG